MFYCGMNISFGNKIPRYKCQIYDNKSDEFKNATMYELTCSSKSDLRYFKKLKDEDWIFIDSFQDKSENKYRAIKSKEEIPKEKFYSVELKRNKPIGLCIARFDKNNVLVDYIESQNENYKYIGQNILAALSKNENIKSMIIPRALRTVKNFYIQACGFNLKKDEGATLELENNHLDDFVQNVEKRAQKEIEILNTKKKNWFFM